MNVLVVEPMKAPYKKEIDSGLESLQREVGGYIEQFSYGMGEDAAIICNEEGKLDGLELNRAMKDERGKIVDIIAGTFLVVGLGEDDYCSLTPEQMKKYQKKFRYPETFMRFGGEIVAIQITPRTCAERYLHPSTPER